MLDKRTWTENKISRVRKRQQEKYHHIKGHFERHTLFQDYIDMS